MTSRGRHRPAKHSVRVADLTAAVAREICELFGVKPLGPLDRAMVKPVAGGGTVVFWDAR